MSAPLIEALNLSKIYGPPFTPFGLVRRAFRAGFSALGRENIKAVDSLSFSVDGGGVCGFLGPNGAGKTTTLKMLAGLLRPSEGQVRLFGSDPRSEWSSVFKRTGGLIDKPNLYNAFSGRTNLRLKALLYDYPVKDNFASILEEFSLTQAADRAVSTYSTGMKQRLAIAVAMVHEPELLFLDEPSRGLDPKGQAEIREILLKIRKKGNTTIFLSSHMLHEVEQVCDKVVIIDKGEHLYTGDARSLDGGKKKVRVVTPSADKARKVLSSSKAVESFEIAGGRNLATIDVELKSKEDIDLPRELVDGGVHIIEFYAVKSSLEEFFLKVTARKDDSNGSH